MRKPKFPARPESEEFIFKKFEKIVKEGKIPKMSLDEIRNFYRWLTRVLEEGEKYPKRKIVEIGIRTFLGNDDIRHLKLFLHYAGEEGISVLTEILKEGFADIEQLLEDKEMLKYVLPAMKGLEEEQLAFFKKKLLQLENEVYGEELSYLMELLYRIDPARTKERLKKMLFDWDPKVRKTAVKILKKNADDTIIQLFKRMLIEEEDPEIRKMLEEVIK